MRPIILALMLPLAACGDFGGSDDGKPGVPASGSGGTRSYQVADFTAVELRGPDDVDVRVGTAFSVRAEGAADQLDRIKIERDGDTLKVGRVRSGGFAWNSGKSVKIFVTMPRITEATLAGSGDLAVDRVDSAAFEGSIAGSGNLTIGTIATRKAELSLAGSGNIKASGTADSLEVEIAGSGDVEADGLTAARADISIAGSGSVAATVNGPAKISILGSGDVTLKGKPQCETSKMGSGSVRCG